MPVYNYRWHVMSIIVPPHLRMGLVYKCGFIPIAFKAILVSAEDFVII